MFSVRPLTALLAFRPRPRARHRAPRPLSAGLAGSALALTLMAGGGLGLGLAPQVARADQSDQIVFDVMLRGLRAGELRINGKIAGTGYGANGTLQSTGLLGAIRKMRYETSVNGQVSGPRFTPMRYTETADTPSRQSQNTIVYNRGTPVSVSHVPARPRRERDLDPRAQGGTVDPLTALYAVLRDVPRDQACNVDMPIFDGARRTRVTLAQPTAEGEGVTCAGEYRRVAGFSDSDMAEKTRFPFTLHYAPIGADRLRVVEITTDTIYGTGRLQRRSSQ